MPAAACGRAARGKDPSRNLMATYTLIHVAISLIGLAAGFVVIGGMLSNRRLDGSTHVFLATTAATSLTGFGFPFTKFLPSHAVGIVSLVALAVAYYAWYAKQMSGPWRLAFVATAVASQYLNVFVLIVQMFLKFPQLQALAPKQTEPAFALTQGATFVASVALGVLAAKKFRGELAAA